MKQHLIKLDQDCIEFLQTVLPKLKLRWPGFRKVRRQVCKRIQKRINQLDLPDYKSYLGYLENHSEEWQRVKNLGRSHLYSP